MFKHFLTTYGNQVVLPAKIWDEECEFCAFIVFILTRLKLPEQQNEGNTALTKSAQVLLWWS